jgi:hypothetical protein
MEWLQTLSIIGTVLASAYYIHREIQDDMKSFREELRAQSARSDRLYEMFYELVKVTKR